MRGAWATWGAANVVGGALVALPDTGPRLFSLSELHGPGVVDAVGAIVLTAGWVVLDVAVWRRRRVLATRRLAVAAAAAAFLAGLVVLVPTIAFDLGAWWVAGVGLMAGAQLWAAVVVTRRQAPAGP